MNTQKIHSDAGGLMSLANPANVKYQWVGLAFDTRTNVVPTGNGPRGISFKCGEVKNFVMVGLQSAGWNNANPKASHPETWDTSTNGNFKQMYDALYPDPSVCSNQQGVCSQSTPTQDIFDAGFYCAANAYLGIHFSNGWTWKFVVKDGSYIDKKLAVILDGNEIKWYVDDMLVQKVTGQNGRRKGDLAGPYWPVANINGCDACTDKASLHSFAFVTASGEAWGP
jgi:hypothetical protein